jgi:hypothetical protein
VPAAVELGIGVIISGGSDDPAAGEGSAAGAVEGARDDVGSHAATTASRAMARTTSQPGRMVVKSLAPIASARLDPAPILRDGRENPRTVALRYIRRAGLDPWPRLFQNLRASLESELASEELKRSLHDGRQAMQDAERRLHDLAAESRREVESDPTPPSATPPREPRDE